MERLIVPILCLILNFNARAYTFVFHVHNQAVEEHEIDQEKMVERHNYYREKLGIPPVSWSDDLAEYAQAWADRLALKCALQHRSSGKYGENIYMRSSNATEDYVVDRWASEEKYFDHKRRKYQKRMGSKYGHYTQIIWRETTHIGAGVKNCRHGGQIWVCNYDPPGNFIGEAVY